MNNCYKRQCAIRFLTFDFRAPQSAPAKSKTDRDPTEFKVHKAFKILEEAMLDDKENLIEKVRGVYCFKVLNSSGKEGMWIIDAKNGKGSVTFYGTGTYVGGGVFFTRNSRTHAKPKIREPEF